MKSTNNLTERLVTFFRDVGIARWSLKDVTRMEEVWGGPLLELPHTPFIVRGCITYELRADHRLSDHEIQELQGILGAAVIPLDNEPRDRKLPGGAPRRSIPRS